MNAAAATVRTHAAGASVPRLSRAGDPRARRWRPMLLVLLASAPVLLVAYVLLGAGLILTPMEAWRALAADAAAPRLHEIAVATRVPRGLLALIVGAGLGVAGSLLQALTRNALASPDLTGVTAGAVAAAVAWVTFGPRVAAADVTWLVPFVGTAGGLTAALAVYALSRSAVGSTRLLLMGILVSGILASSTTLVLLFASTSAAKLFEWLAGSLLGTTWWDVGLAGGYVVLGGLLLMVALPRANALQLGDDVAVGLGQRREADRFLVLLTAVVLTAGAVSVVGAVGFVGLIGPHIVRGLVGSDLRRLVPAAGLGGALMVLLADLLARNVEPNALIGAAAGETLQSGSLPVGVYLSMIGIPFLLSLLRRRAR